MDSFIAWIGGKKLLRKEIVKKFPEKMSFFLIGSNPGSVLFYQPSKNKYLKYYKDQHRQ